jgi:hypothetical protein
MGFRVRKEDDNHDPIISIVEGEKIFQIRQPLLYIGGIIGGSQMPM